MNTSSEHEVYLFLDMSNIFIAAQEFGLTHDKNTTFGHAIRLAFQNLLALASARRTIKRAYCATSGDHRLDPVLEQLRALGVSVEKLERGCFSGREQGVDQCLQNHMLRSCLDERTPKVAVLMTGDGAGYEEGKGFHADLERLHSRGWGIEVLSWNQACNHRLRNWAMRRGVYVPLDEHYESITFIEDVRSEAPLDLTKRKLAQPRSSLAA